MFIHTYIYIYIYGACRMSQVNPPQTGQDDERARARCDSGWLSCGLENCLPVQANVIRRRRRQEDTDVQSESSIYEAPSPHGDAKLCLRKMHSLYKPHRRTTPYIRKRGYRGWGRGGVGGGRAKHTYIYWRRALAEQNTKTMYDPILAFSSWRINIKWTRDRGTCGWQSQCFFVRGRWKVAIRKIEIKMCIRKLKLHTHLVWRDDIFLGQLWRV